MSKVIPFKALLPKFDLVSSIISPPYDVLSSDQARELAENNPYSFLHVTKSEIDLPPDVNEYDDLVYRKAADNLERFKREKYLKESDAAFYVYRAVMGDHTQTGIVCGVSVDEYEKGLIKKHEKTREVKVVDRTRHAYSVQAHTEPVMLVHRASEAIYHLISETEARMDPLYDVVDKDGVRHFLWRASNTMALQSAFGGLSALYIADGHHRSESASRVRELMKKENPNHAGTEAYNYFPAVIFPHDEVKIYRYDWSGNPFMRPLSKYSMEDVMDLADENGIMPPKSTWFAPKLTSGLFVYIF